MIDIEKIILRAIELTRRRDLVVAAPYELPTELCRLLLERKLIAGYVAESAAAANSGDPSVAGWWTNRDSGRWHLRRGANRRLLFLGTEGQLGGRMLWAALQVGISVIYLIDAGSEEVRPLTVLRALLSRMTTGLMYRALENRLVGEVVGGLRYTSTSYENAFEELFRNTGDAFRLKPEDFVPGRAVMILGSLGPGGAERQAALSAVELARDGRWQPMIGCSFLEGGGSDFHLEAVRRGGVPAEVVPQSPEEMRDPSVQRILAESNRFRHIGFQHVAYVILCYACFIRKMRPSLVQTWMDYSNVLAGVAAALVGVPGLVLSGRSMAPDNFTIFQPYMRPGYLALLRHRGLVFTNNSRAGARDYARWLGVDESCFRVLHNGIEFPDAKPQRAGAELRASLGIPDGATVVGTIIRFSEEKRPELWIDTAERVLRQFPDTYFVAFGGGVQLEEIRSKVEQKKLCHRILLPGVTKDPWVALTIMDVFLLTSRMEGLPNVLLEAQAMGVPVVTTGRGGMTETYVEGETGFTAEASPEQLASRIEALLRDRGVLERAGARAALFVRDRFAMESMVSKTLEVFEAASAVSKA